MYSLLNSGGQSCALLQSEGPCDPAQVQQRQGAKAQPQISHEGEEHHSNGG